MSTSDFVPQTSAEEDPLPLNVVSLMFGNMLLGLPIVPAILILTDAITLPDAWQPYDHLLVAGSILLGSVPPLIRAFIMIRRAYLKVNKRSQEASIQYVLMLVVLSVVGIIGFSGYLAIWGADVPEPEIEEPISATR